MDQSRLQYNFIGVVVVSASIARLAAPARVVCPASSSELPCAFFFTRHIPMKKLSVVKGVMAYRGSAGRRQPLRGGEEAGGYAEHDDCDDDAFGFHAVVLA